MTDPTQEQRARWLDMADKSRCLVVADIHGISRVVCEGDAFLTLCAAITREAVTAERQRLGLDEPGVEMADEEMLALVSSYNGVGNDDNEGEIMHVTFELGDLVRCFRALLASQADRERLAERAQLSAGVDMTNEEIDVAWSKAHYEATDGKGTVPHLFARALIAEASARATAAERERCARWHDAKAEKEKVWEDFYFSKGSERSADQHAIERLCHEQSATAHRAGEGE